MGQFVSERGVNMLFCCQEQILSLAEKRISFKFFIFGNLQSRTIW